jgi:hypothetical protein
MYVRLVAHAHWNHARAASAPVAEPVSDSGPVAAAAEKDGSADGDAATLQNCKPADGANTCTDSLLQDIRRYLGKLPKRSSVVN